MSQAILDGCTGVAVRAVGRLLLKGKSQALQAYGPIAATDIAACAAPAEYAAALHLLQADAASQPQAALALFETLAARHPHDPLVALHLRRLRQGDTDDLLVLAEK